MTSFGALSLSFVATMLSGAPVASPTGELSLAEAASLAVTANPALATYAWDVRAAEARVLQAGLRPNPELSIEAEEVRLSAGPAATARSFGLASDGTIEVGRERGARARRGFQEADLTVSLAHIVERGGKRARRVAVAQREKELADWDYEAARTAVLAEVAQRFVAVLAAQERVALAEESLDVAERQVRTEAEEVEAGVESPLVLLRSEAQRDMVALDRDRARRGLSEARSALAALWGETEPRFDRAVGAFGPTAEPPLLESLRSEIERHPDLARWATEVEQRRAVLRLAQAEAKPDVVLMGGVRFRGLQDSRSAGWSIDSTGAAAYGRGRETWDRDIETTFVLGVAIELPLFDRNQGGILEAEHLAAKVEDERRAVRLSIDALLTAAHLRMEGAHRESLHLADEILPRLEDALARTREGHRLGKLAYRDVLEVEQALNETKVQYVEALAAYHAAAAELGGLIGRPVVPAADPPPGTDEEELP